MRLFIRLEYKQMSCASCPSYFMPIPKNENLISDVTQWFRNVHDVPLLLL
jgi:hypothetical protein